MNKLLKNNKKSKFVTLKITHWLLIIYVGVLLLSIPLVTLLTNDTISSREKVEDWNEERELSHFYTAIHEGNVEQLGSRHLINEEAYDYGNQSLNIRSNSGIDISINVERTDRNDGKIEALVYTNGLIISGYDFSDMLVPINFRLVGDTLEVIHPEHQSINIAIVRNEFTINQFTGQKPINDVAGGGQLEVYLKIPQSLQINEEPNVHIQYVNE